MIARVCRCGGRIRDNVCDRCGPTKTDKARGTSTQRGYDGRWQRESERYKREHPLCVCCEAQGRATGRRGRTGILVDHIVPKAMAPELFWDRSNWQTLCHACDQQHKKPIERRCTTAGEIRREWAALLVRLASQSGTAL